jgi:micrococcal nuclease
MSRLRILVIGAVLAAGACQPATPPSAPTETRGATNPPGDTGRVTSVSDGDSFAADIDGSEEEVRLLGINAPEGNECYGHHARDTLTSMLAGNDLVLVRGSPEDRDDFGRLLRYAWVDGASVNEAMLAHGEAIALQSEHDLDDEFLAIAESAAAAGLGLWGREVCGPSEPQDIQIARIAHDPAGRDEEALNEEYVEIGHEGDDRVDLTGWVLRDESSSNRYVFDHALRPGGRLIVHSGCGTDSAEDVYWCAAQPIWSNGGDTAILQDEHGNVVSRRAYRGG